MRSNIAINEPQSGRTVAGSINELFSSIRQEMLNKPDVSIATAYINPAGYVLLADELNAAPRVRLLIGAEPEFEVAQSMTTSDANQKQQLDSALKSHESWLAAERDLSGFTVEALAAAQRMVEWLESVNDEGLPRVEVRRFNKGFLHGKTFMIKSGRAEAAVSGSSNFTFAGLSKNAELNLATEGHPGHVREIGEWFDYYWEQSEEFALAEMYKAQWQPYEPWPIFVRMLRELYGNDLFDEEHTQGRLGLTNFQRDGVARMKRLLAENGGVLVADEVGLGKSYLAAEVVLEATEEKRQRAVIIAPAAIKSSMWDPFLDKMGFRRNVKVYSYEEIRNRMEEPLAPSDDAEPQARAHYQAELFAWEEFKAEVEDYALVVIDEAHNLRNPGAQRSDAVDRLILSGKRPKQVVLLTATPVNNSLADLETLVKYFVRDDARFAAAGIPSIREYIKRASDMNPDNLSPEHLFDLMDRIAVRRTRKFIRDNYTNDFIINADGQREAIKFPTPKSTRIDYDLDPKGQKLVERMLYALSVDELDDSNNDYSSRKHDPHHLMLARYQSSRYRIDAALEATQVQNAGLLRSALLKRLESSPHALHRSLERLIEAHESFLTALHAGYVITGTALSELTNTEAEDFEAVLQAFDSTNRDDVEPLALFHHDELIEDVESDLVLLHELALLANDAKQGPDFKFNELVKLLIQISKDSKRPDHSLASEGDRRKVIVFSSFADTIDELHERLEAELKTSSNQELRVYKDRLAQPIYGATPISNRTNKAGGVDQRQRAALIAGFAPRTAGNAVGDQVLANDKFDILLTTDVLAEGVNLQQAGRIINYDLPWNPMRIVQRHGRVDRIGSHHDYVYLSLFFPNQMLDEMLGLEARLQRKLAQAHAAVGEHIEVLAGGRTQTDVILNDKTMGEWDAFLEGRGGVAAISGEEFRRRLYKHLLDNPAERDRASLPFGAGSGFESDRLSKNGYVFCARIGKHQKPWFRFVQAEDDWSISRSEDAESVARISGDSLVALTAADPGSDKTARLLDPAAYDGAFAAWQAAKDHIFAEWTHLADPRNLAPKRPKAFKEAQKLLEENSTHLDRDAQNDLYARLMAVPSRPVELIVGRIVRDEALDVKAKILAIQQAIADAGIQPPPKREALEPVNEHEVRLVTWMAVTAKRPAQEVFD